MSLLDVLKPHTPTIVGARTVYLSGTPERPAQVHRYLTAEEKATCLRLRHEGLAFKEIARLMNISHTSARRTVIRELGKA